MGNWWFTDVSEAAMTEREELTHLSLLHARRRERPYRMAKMFLVVFGIAIIVLFIVGAIKTGGTFR
jgi:hypothetical protein